MKVLRHGNRTNATLLVLAIGVATIGFGGMTYAQSETVDRAAEHAEAASRATERAAEKRHAAQEKAEQAKARAQAKVSEAKERLEGKKLKACEAREKRIDATMEQMTKRGQTHIAVFTKISDRVQAFYTDKGRTVENYDALVADVQAKKLAAEQAVSGAQSVGEVFSCASDNPKIASAEFRDAHKAQVAALKEYRTSVKNLIVAVKSAQSTEAKADKAGATTNE